MAEIVPRYIVTFSAIKGGNIVDLKFQINSPAMTFPLPGDEVRLPDEVAKKAGFSKTIFKVASRCFLYTGLPMGIAGAVSLTLSQES